MEGGADTACGDQALDGWCWWCWETKAGLKIGLLVDAEGPSRSLASSVFSTGGSPAPSLPVSDDSAAQRQSPDLYFWTHGPVPKHDMPTCMLPCHSGPE